MIPSTRQRRYNPGFTCWDNIMPKIVDQTGNKFGKLLVLELGGKSGNDRKCHVRCDCGVEKEVVQSKLTAKTKPIRSCGCLSKENHYRTHERTHHKWYAIWKAMISRCYRPNQKAYKNYGGRGIIVCDEWKNNLDAFFQWLEENQYKKGLQIDRKNNDGNYCPENCRVVTPKENCNNRRDNKRYNVEGEALTLSQLSEKSGIKYNTLRKRIKQMNMSAEDAIEMKLWQRTKTIGE